MAVPNDMSRIVESVAGAAASDPNFTNASSKAARRLIRRTFVLHKPAIDGSASTTTAYTAADQIRMPCAGRIMGAYVQPAAACTADATNNATVNVVTADGAGGAAVVAASLTTDVAGASWVAGVTKTMTVTGTAANTRYVTGAVLSFNITKASSGVAVPVSAITVDVEEEDIDGYSV